jgi:FkbM family methyltransferase
MIKSLTNKLLSKLGYRIVKRRAREDTAFDDQKRLLNPNRESVIFDVGAYDGEVAKRYSRLTGGNCKVFAFEPFPSSFNILKKNTKEYHNILPFSLALSNKTGQGVLHSNKFAATNSLLPSSNLSVDTWQSDLLSTKHEINVPTSTLDDFVDEHEISKIDILKMDTQGSEFMVLEGATNSLQKGLIKMIYMEIIVMPTYVGQKPLDEVLAIMRNYDFKLFNIYQSLNSQGRIRYLDALFFHQGQDSLC